MLCHDPLKMTSVRACVGTKICVYYASVGTLGVRPVKILMGICFGFSDDFELGSENNSQHGRFLR